MKKIELTRRRFLTGSAAMAMFSGTSVAGSRAELSESRKNLKEPGPMIPPVPAILLTVTGDEKFKDEISVVWTFVVNGKPPQIGISAEHTHFANGLIRKHKEFALNVPSVEMVTGFDKVDMNSSRGGDKFKLSGFTRGKASKILAPVIQESPIHLECKVFNIVEVPPVRTVFLAEVVATSVVEGACDANGRLNVEKVPFFGMTAGSGEFFTMGKKVGHIGQSVGRSDIKY